MLQIMEKNHRIHLHTEACSFSYDKMSTIQPHGGNIPGFGPQGDINVRASSNMRQSSGAAGGMNSVRMSQNPLSRKKHPASPSIFLHDEDWTLCMFRMTHWMWMGLFCGCPYMQEYFETRTEEGDNLEGDNYGGVRCEIVKVDIVVCHA